MRYRLPAALIRETFAVFRQCGGGWRECQVLWTGPWSAPGDITQVVHPHHVARRGGFELDSSWINRFWIDLAREAHGIRVQVHTHPAEAFHSPTDDAYPIVHMPGFLSLVVPNFGVGPERLESTYLAELGHDGRWREVVPGTRLEITP
jgi:hypothetical protein